METKGIHGQTGEDDEALNLILSALVCYDEDEIRRLPLTHSRLKLVNKHKVRLNEADSLLVEGILQYDFLHDQESSNLFVDAHEKGCTHPILHLFLGQYHRKMTSPMLVCTSVALDCYVKSIGGTFVLLQVDPGCRGTYPLLTSVPPLSLHVYAFCITLYCAAGSMLGHFGIVEMYEDDLNIASPDDKVKAYTYLLELERQGHVDASLFYKLFDHNAECLLDWTGSLLAFEYCDRAMGMGHVPAIRDWTYKMWGFGGYGSPEKCHKVIATLLEAVETWGEDDRLLDLLIDRLCTMHRTPSDTLDPLLSKFGSYGEAVMHYCDVLIQRGSPLGYLWKSDVYHEGKVGVPRDVSKAVSLYAEADRLGLATFDFYTLFGAGLIRAYMYVYPSPSH